jgi:hypothetical protein
VTQTEEIDKAVKDERKHDGSELEGMNEGTRKKKKEKKNSRWATRGHSSPDMEKKILKLQNRLQCSHMTACACRKRELSHIQEVLNSSESTMA